LLCTGGYDGTCEELFFIIAGGALERGYNVLVFDGPGQGGALVLQKLPMRPDWENVVTPVVDYLLKRRDVDPPALRYTTVVLAAILRRVRRR
jgi:alpha-beta hydrolase superfamily lysophospholipase